MCGTRWHMVSHRHLPTRDFCDTALRSRVTGGKFHGTQGGAGELSRSRLSPPEASPRLSPGLNSQLKEKKNEQALP